MPPDDPPQLDLYPRGSRTPAGTPLSAACEEPAGGRTEEQPTRGELIDRLRLLRSENVGPVTYHQLVRRFGGAKAALEGLPELARRGGRHRELKIGTAAAARRELEALDRIGAVLLAPDRQGYPEALAALDDAPPLLSVLGDAGLLATRRAVAVVGARNASANGRRLAEMLARGLGEAGWLVVSGMARGIDSAAHAACLDTGTVAVLAGGVDNIYPPENEDLYAAIADRGVVVSEQPVGTEPQARHFPRRNRLISGLSLGVIVVEAAQRSGSLITARFAGDQGREVFAVPGSPLDPRCRGSNGLLRQGAVITESVDDVLTALAAMAGPPVREPNAIRRQGPDRERATGLTEARADVAGASDTAVGQVDRKPAPPAAASEIDKARGAVIEGLGPTPVPVDELIRRCQVSAGAARTVLLELELAGRLERQPGNQVALVS